MFGSKTRLEVQEKTMQRMTKRIDVETLETKLNQDKHLKVVAKTPRSHLSPEKGA